jgi:hypothetical protein
MAETSDHAALRIGGSFGVRFMRAIAALSVVSPDPRHQHTHKRTEARENTEYEQHGPDAEDPSVKKPFAETMTTPPDGDVLADRSLCPEHGSLSDLILHPSCE